MTDPDLLAPDLQSLLQLFSSLPDVRFPDLDSTAMQDAVARVKERHLELLHVEAQLAAVRASLDEESEALLKKGHRLHSYLKVFAEHDESLSLKLEALTLPRIRKAAPTVAPVRVEVNGEVAAPKKRGRPRKIPVSDALFSDPASSERQPTLDSTATPI